MAQNRIRAGKRTRHGQRPRSMAGSMDVDFSFDEMEVDEEFCEFRKFVTWNEKDVVGTVVKPDMGKPWRPTTAHYVESRRVRRLYFIPGTRMQRKNELFAKGCDCNSEDDACKWCLHFNLRYSANGLAEAAAQHRAAN